MEGYLRYPTMGSEGQKGISESIGPKGWEGHFRDPCEVKGWEGVLESLVMGSKGQKEVCKSPRA